MSSMSNSIQQVRETIEKSAIKSGRDPQEIRLVAVSKTHPAANVREAYNAGLTLFGENRVQEAESKIQELKDLPLEWHLIGHLQSNKVKKAFSLFSMIHSVDRAKLIRALDEEGEKQSSNIDILLQVNVSGEESKFGVSHNEFETLLRALQEANHLRCRGLMTIPPFLDDPEEVRPYFCELRNLAERYKDDFLAPECKLELSMGMTNDYHVAIEEGATMVRVGTAIFGARNYT